MMMLAGLPIVIALVVEGGTIDGGNTVMLLLAATGVVGLGAGLRAVFCDRIPRATVTCPPRRAADSRRLLR